MANFYSDNPDIAHALDALDLSEIASLFEEDFRFASEYPFAPKDAADAIDNYKRALSLCGDIIANRIAPLAAESDRVGNVLNDDGSVTYAPSIRLALDLFAKTGLLGVTIPYSLGGLNMPETILSACNDIVSRGDVSLMNIFGLQGIAETINMFGDDELRRTYVPRLVSGELTGAMVLTEPDAGSDLQSVKTMATQAADGSWRVNGVKRFITNGCGDVLLVLARTEPGTTDGRGLSCLLVEKGPWVKVRRLEDKVGIHASPTCEIVFTDAPAKLVGQRKRGLITYVMTLMNGARVGISAQATGLAEAAFRVARDYAATRRQFGVTIDTFAPIRELLVEMSVGVQAARALSYAASYFVDLETGLTRRFESLKGSPEAASLRARIKKIAAINKMITPMAKYFASETAQRVANDAISVLGGSGYMRDYPAERLWRDARITTIYEGTSQLQVIAAIAGVRAGVVTDVVDEMFADLPKDPAVAGTRQTLGEFEKSLAEACEQIASAERSYHDLVARRLVDAGVTIIVSAALARQAINLQSMKKFKVFGYWLKSRGAALPVELMRVTSGENAPLTEFDDLVS